MGQKLRFPCGRWLDRGEDDGAIVRDLFPNPLQTEFYTPCNPQSCVKHSTSIYNFHLLHMRVFFFFFSQLFHMRLKPLQVMCLEPEQTPMSSLSCMDEMQYALSRKRCASTNGRGGCTLKEELRTCSLLRY